MPTQEQGHKQERTTDFKEILGSILDGGGMSIEKSKTDRYPSEAKRMLESVTKEEVEEAIRRQADFSNARTSYVDGLDEAGFPRLTSSERTEKSFGITRAVYLTLREDESNNIKICANVDLLRIQGQEPQVKVYLYASKMRLDFGRWSHEEGGDGQCRHCSGSGCWECGFSGGY